MALSKPLEALVNANSGAWAGLWATLAIAPIDSIKVLLQAGNSSDGNKGIIGTLIDKYRKEGPASYYTGVSAKVLWSMIGKWFFYGAYFTLTTQYERITQKSPTFLANLLIASAADMSHVPISAPLEKIATQAVKHSETVPEVVARIYKSSGIGGFLPNPRLYLLLSLSPSLTNTIFTQVKNLLLKARKKPLDAALGAGESFLIGAIARAFATILIFPFIRAKIVMQAEKTMGVQECLSKVYKEGGFWNLYRGLNAELVRGVFSSAVTLMLKERSAKMNRSLVLFFVSLLGWKPTIKRKIRTVA